MILVVGATGQLGGAVARRLVLAGHQVRGMVRPTSDPAKVTALRDAGVETVVGDLRTPPSLADACRGVDAVVLTASSMPFSYIPRVNDIATTDTVGVLHLVEAAGEAGVKRFVYTSMSGNLDTPCPLQTAKRTIETALERGPTEYTILRPSCFMEVWLGPAVGFDPERARATIYGEGTSPISWISVQDVAEFAARAVTAPEAKNRILELGGPRAISPSEAVGIFARIGGQPFVVQQVPVEALESQRATATDAMQESFAALMCSYARGDAIPMDEILAIFPVELTTVEQYAERVYGMVPAGVG